MSKSRDKEDIFGDKYAEHVDNDDQKIGESREQKDIFDDKYTEHVDKDHQKVGESREKEDIFGDKYTEHVDKDHQKTGESREKEDIFGDKYIEHSRATGMVETRRVWEMIQDKAGVFGAVIGAVLGLIDAVMSGADFSGYLLYIGGGALLMGLMASFVVMLLPWALLLAVVVLFIKGCS